MSRKCQKARYQLKKSENVLLLNYASFCSNLPLQKNFSRSRTFAIGPVGFSEKYAKNGENVL